jgi:hypothetical protein
MTDRDDFAELRKQLTPIDVDHASAELIARRARQSVGRGRSLRRFLEPAVVVLVTTSFLTWMVLKLVEVFG